MIGQTISHYKILQKLGEGGMGEVYLAEDTSLGRKVAIKFLASDQAADPESRKRFVHEAKSQALVSHTNITSFYEVGEEGDKVFIVMEYVEGQTLSRLASAEKLSLPVILDLAIQVGEGLQAAHERGVMHRDINPNNILVTSKREVKITDFGLAKWKGASTITRTGLQMGTDSYMSPEQLEGKKADFRTDIFSLGVVLYEFICSHRPFEGNNREALFYEILYTQPQPLARFCRGITEGLERLVMKCLAKKPEERYQSMADLVADLKTLKRTNETGILPANLERWKAKNWRNVVLATVGLVLIATLGFLLFTGRGEAIDSVAVLPFVNAGADSSLEYLSDGLTESLIFNLSRLPKLKVIARASVFTFKGRAIDAREVGKKLGVRAVLTGRMVPQGEQLSISVELMDARENRSIWGERYNRKFSDVAALQDEIARDMADQLRLQLSGEETQTLTKRYTEDPEAYRLYLLGQFHYNKPIRESLKKAADYFNQAIEKDPNYALAYAGLAICYGSFNSYGLLPPKEAFDKEEAAAKRALEIDRSLAEAYVALADKKYCYDWNFTGAGKDYQKALVLNPNYALGHESYAEYLLASGRLKEMALEVQRAQELDPLSLTISYWLGTAFAFARQPNRAIEQFKKTLEMDPNLAGAYGELFAAYWQKGMYAEAVAAGIRSWELSGEDSVEIAAQKKAYERSGARGYLLRCIETLRKKSKHEYVPPSWFAFHYARLGERDSALHYLQKLYEERSFLVLTLKESPAWDSLRSDPRFVELVKKVEAEKR